jgi:hypothetical protein
VLNGDDIRAAAAACHGFLEPAIGRDWSAAVPGLDFTVASVVAHAANGATPVTRRAASGWSSPRTRSSPGVFLPPVPLA